MKVLINTCYGGFSVSEAVYQALGMKWEGYGYLENEDFQIVDDNLYAYRTYSALIKVVEELGVKAASGSMSALKIVDIPDDVDFTIEEYDGLEWVAETHRTWS